MTTHEFFTSLFGKKLGTDYLCIWIKNKKKGGTSYCFTDLRKAATFAQVQAEKFDVYFSIALSARAYGAHRRLKEADVVAIPGLWGEVDYQPKGGGVHKKKNIPETEEQALSLIHSMPVPPTLIVSSGNGFHAYWLFHNLFRLSTPEERQAAKVLSERWQRLLKRNAEKFGWDIDSTFDLARLYRPVGTKNHKDSSNIKEVCDVEHN